MRDRGEHARPIIPPPQETRSRHSSSASSSSLSGHLVIYDATQATQTLKLISWNINGCTKENAHIRLTALSHLNADIICLGETHLKNENTVNIDNYVPYNHKRQSIHINAHKGSGGVYFSVKNCVYIWV